MTRLRQLCQESSRINDVDYNAFKKEIGALEIHGYDSYLLYLYDNNIRVSNKPNSTVAYLIGITDEKPTASIKYKGGTIPDIDIDNMQARRDEGKEYLKFKYGADKVASIGTYSMLYAKGAIRYAGKALDKDPALINKLATLIPELVQGENWEIDDAMEVVPELKELEEQNKDAAEILKYARKLSGIIYARSKHAAGVVVSPRPIHEIAPVRSDDDGNAIIEFDGNEIEALGLLKIDLLGIKTLDIIDMALKLINERHSLSLTPYDIPLDDPEAYRLIASGNLMGIFQLEGQGISQVCKQFRPQSVLDVSMISALYRPGPLQFIPSVIAVKNGEIPEVVPHGERFPVLREILSETYQFFCYQEQIQKVAEVLAGFNDSEADSFRRVIAKKKREEMAEQLEKFSAGAQKNGLTQEEIDALVLEIESFSAYCFNKSHAVSYSILSVQLAWLKAHYAAEFYTANIIFELSSLDKVVEFILEAKRMSIDVLPPDVNYSSDMFSVIDNKTIRFGLAGIEQVGHSASEPIVEERRANGKFRSVSEFLYRINPRINVVRNMIQAGAFDAMAYRSQLLAVVRTEKDAPVTYIEDLADMVKTFKDKGWEPLDFDREWIPLPITSDYTVVEKMDMEKKVTRLHLSSQTKIVYAPAISAFRRKHGMAVVGYMKEWKPFKNGNGAWFTVSDEEGKYFLFQREYNAIQKKGGLQQYEGKLIAVALRGFKPEEGLFAVNSIELFASDSEWKTTIDIPLNSRGLRFLEDKKSILSSFNKIGSDKYSLQIRFVGKNKVFTVSPGCTGIRL